MKNKVLGVIFGILFFLAFIAIPTAQARNDEAGTTVKTVTSNKNADKIALAREKRVLIKTQRQELAQLREELKAKIALKKAELNQYREKEELTEKDRENIEETVEIMTKLQVKLGLVYGNAQKAIKSYKSDKSENKLTGLDLVIASQQERIKLLQEAIELLD